MENFEEDKRSMYFSVKVVCNNNKPIWSGLVAFAEAFGEFETTISNIDTQRLIQEGETTGITADKQKVGEEMIQVTLEVAGAVYAYASKIGNNELMKKVNYSHSKLKQSRDSILRDICQLIHDEANNIIADLTDYGKTAQDLEQQQKKIDDFSAIIAKPRVAITSIKTATQKLKELFKTADNILKTRLDKLIEKYKKTQPKFYTDYKSARIIISTGKQTTALSVLIKDSAGNPIPNVSATITNIPAGKSKDIINEISKKTGVKGLFRITNLAEGNYKLNIKKLGFVEQTLNFNVVKGETTKVVAVLESILSAEIQ